MTNLESVAAASMGITESSWRRLRLGVRLRALAIAKRNLVNGSLRLSPEVVKLRKINPGFIG